MKKLSLLIAIAMLLSIGGVYATWVYSQSDDIADITNARAMVMTEATFEGTYGTYSTDSSTLKLMVDPKPGTTHTTSLQLSGEIVIKFTPATYAPADVKEHGVPTTFTFGVSNNTWTYESQDIITVNTTPQKLGHYDGEGLADGSVAWVKGADGAFTYTITADMLTNAQGTGFWNLTEFELDTKADYDAYDTVLTQGQLTLTISDGKNASTITTTDPETPTA